MVGKFKPLTKLNNKMKNAKKTSPSSPRLPARGLVFWLSWLRKGLICAMLFIMPMLIYLGNTEYGYTKAIFTLVTVSALAGAWLIEMIARKNYTLQTTKLLWPGLGLIGAGALSIIASQSLNVSLQSLNLLFYFGFFLIILANSIESENDATLFLSCLLAAALPTSLYAIFQYYGWQPGPSGYAGGRESIISFMGNRNYVAEFLAFLVAPCLIIFFRERTKWLNKLLYAATILVLLCSVLALAIINSAAIWLGFFAGAVFFVMALGSIWFLRRLTHSRRRWTLTFTSTFVVLLLAISSWGMIDIIKHPDERNTPTRQIFGPIWELWEANSGDIRSWDWWIGYEMWKTSPWIGQGVGNFKLKFLEYKSIFAETERGKQFNFHIRPAAQAHNEFVQLAAEMGIVGMLATFIVLAILFGATLVAAYRAPTSRERAILLALLSGVVVILTDAIFAFPFHLPASSLAFVFLVGVLHSKWLQPDARPLRLSQKVVAPWALLILLSFGTLIVSVMAIRDWVGDTCLDRAQRYAKRVSTPGNWERARALLEECTLSYDFQPSDVYYHLGALYDYQARFLQNSKDKQKHSDEIRDAQQKSIDYYKKYLSAKPSEYTYIQIALAYRRQASLAREENRTEDADEAFRLAEAELKKLLDKHPSQILEREALYTINVLIPLAKTNPETALPLVEEFLAKHTEYAKAYLTRGEIYRSFVMEGRQEYCELARNDLNKTIQLVNAEIKEINIQADEPRGPQVPIEIYLPILSQSKDVAEQELRKLPC
jgi:O-antigen ligase/tetratricopeptide (TPR) repeat protein